MQNTISIVVSRRPGLLAQVVSTLVREDCKLVRQTVSNVGDPALQRFTITVEGPETAVADLPRLLRPFGSVEQPAPGAAAGAEPRAADLEAAMRDIVAAFPEVAERVRALARSLPAASRAETLSSLGERLGRREYQRGYALGSPLKLESALRRMVLPAVRQLARAELEGSAIRLPGCPFCAPPRTEATGCDFLIGFACGLLHSAPATADTLVRESRCRAAGDPFCELVFLVA
jgi:predicted hydrocarbon binding protein